MITEVTFKKRKWVLMHDGITLIRIVQEVPVVHAMQPHTRQKEAKGDNAYWIHKMWKLRHADDAEFSITVADYFRDHLETATDKNAGLDKATHRAAAMRAAEDFRSAAIVLRAATAQTIAAR